ncbi:MAG: hypothetical protein HFE63_00910 [Clostridiales bacterium]|nr:hypothetical protein [Clostridiales bacterium]
MNFYRRRPAALALSLCILLSAAASCLPSPMKLVMLVLTVAAVVLLPLILKNYEHITIAGISSRQFALITGVIAVIMLISVCIVDMRADRFRRFADSDEIYPIEAVIVDVDYESGFASTYTVRLRSVDGKNITEKGLIFADSSLGLSIGDVFSANVDFLPLGEVYSDYNKNEGSMMSSGWMFSCRTINDFEYIGDTISFEVFFAKLRAKSCSALSLYLDSDSASLAKALLLAVRDDLGVIMRDFRRIGVSHLLALSGLHIAIIIGMIDRLLLKLRVGRLPRVVITILAIFAFLALIGFPYSALRAGIMISLSMLARIINRSSDRINTLFMAAALILLFDPAAIFDIGFQLSFCATLGVIVMTTDANRVYHEKLYRMVYNYPILKHFRKMLGGIFASLGAIMFIMPLIWLHFGETSCLTVFTTLIMGFFGEILLMLLPAYLICSLLKFHFFAGRLGWLISSISNITAFIASKLSMNSSPVSLKFQFTLPIIIICAAVIIVMMLKDVRNWLYSLIPFGISVTIFFCCVGIYDHSYYNTSNLISFYSNTNDAMVLVSDRRGYFIDISSGSTSLVSPASEYLSNEYLTEFDTCVLTHLHRSHTYSLRKLCLNKLVRRFLIPEPVSESERCFVMDILELADEFNVKVEFYPRPDTASISVGNDMLIIYQHEVISRSTHPLIGLNIKLGNSNILYVGSSFWEGEGKLADIAANSDVVILGSHGPKIKSIPDFDFDSNTIYFTSTDAFEGISGIKRISSRLRMSFKP